MKKIILIIFVLIFNANQAFSIEEITLEQKDLNPWHYGDYLSDIYYGKVENVPKALQLFGKKGLVFENSKINSVKLHMLYSGEMTYLNTEHSGQFFNHDFATVEPKVSVHFNDNKTHAMFDINLTGTIDGYSNWLTQRIRQVYIAHQITPRQTVVLGQYWRLPSTHDGSRGIYDQDMVTKTQLGRTFGNTMSTGIRNLGNYKYVDYDIGLYDSTRFMKDFGNGLDFTGNIMFKPLADVKEKTGDFKIGAGYSVGKNNISYSQYSLFAGYDIKKFHAKIEYASANGYNGIYESKNSAEGMYATLAYDLTPKLQILGRYDVFDYNTNADNDTTSEYSLGFVYKPFENMKVLLNYVFTTGNNQPNSNGILFATRFIL